MKALWSRIQFGVHKRIKNIFYQLSYYFDSSKVVLPEIALDSRFIVSLAVRQEDFEGAFKLIHDDMIYRKLARSLPSGLRLHLHHVMPQNSTLIVKYKDMIVATASVIQDSQLGFVAEKYYSNEVQVLRHEYRNGIVELTTVVIDQAFRSNQVAIFHLILKYALNLCQRNLKSQVLLMTLNPGLETYFEKCWGFKAKGPRIRYTSSPQSRLTLMVCDLTQPSRRDQLHRVPSKKIRHNISLFVRSRDKRFVYPSRAEGQRINPVMTAAMIEYFCVKRTSLYDELDQQSRQVFLEMFLQFFGSQGLSNFIQTETVLNLKEFRLPVDTQVAIKHGEQFFVGAIRDISQSGCYVELPNEFLNSGQTMSLTFYLGEAELKVDGKPIWRNLNSSSKYKRGYGFRFERPIMDLQEQINDWSSTNQKTRFVA